MKPAFLMYSMLFSTTLVGLFVVIRPPLSIQNTSQIASYKRYKPAFQDTLKRCHTMQVLENHLQRSPGIRTSLESVEKRCQSFIDQLNQGKVSVTDTIHIPVVVHVIYNTDAGNISDEQIRSQIKVLNQDFNKKNSDIDQVPEEFENVVADVKLHFELARTFRVFSNKKAWGTQDQMKYNTNGGSNTFEPKNHLNIWVCTIGSGILGYAQFPGDNLRTDGIVVDTKYFGTTNNVQAPFNQGRTTTHEVGHWLNLRHIWGDGNCNMDDFVSDTPVSNQPNYGCPQYPISHCESNDMFMNYMDYVDDSCMFMFTKGQKQRMRSVFAPNGPRRFFLNNQCQSL